MDDTFIRNRISALRIQKNTSERSMSLDLGHSPSYIHSIVSGKALPSMAEFLYICEYLGVTPREFFDEELKNPTAAHEVAKDLSSLEAKQVAALQEIIRGLKQHGKGK